MLTRVPVLVVFAALVVLALCQEQEKPEKRPALLSRYGRAVLPRYGKRSSPSASIESDTAGDENQEIVCQMIDGKYTCLPMEAVRFRPFLV